jgi:hypothetical protein
MHLLLAESFAIRIVVGTDNCIYAVGATSLANALRDNVALTALDLRGALLRCRMGSKFAWVHLLPLRCLLN